MSDFWDEVVKGKTDKKETPPPTITPATPIPVPTQPATSNPTISDPFSESQQTIPEIKTPTIETPIQTQTVKSELFDPFSSPQSTEKEEQSNVFVPVNEVTTTKIPEPSSSPNEPFEKDQTISNEEEFAKQKPSSSGKNLSFMIFGKKGTSKTATALSLPGKVFAISLDQQTSIIHEEFFDKDPRIVVWDGIEFFNSKNPEVKLETAVKTVDYIDWLLSNPCKKFQPDWILFDGTERLSHVCEMAMRADGKLHENGPLLPYQGVKNRNAWKYRNDLVNNFVQRAAQIARIGVIYTAYAEIEIVDTAMGEEKREVPKWFGDIEQKTQIVIKTTSMATQNGRAFVLEVESSKVSFIPTGRKVIVGERLNSGEIQNRMGIKAIFTPEGYKKYFGTGGE